MSDLDMAKKIEQPHMAVVPCQQALLTSARAHAGLFAPQLSSTTMGFGYLSAMGFLYNRGTPDVGPFRLLILSELCVLVHRRDIVCMFFI